TSCPAHRGAIPRLCPLSGRQISLIVSGCLHAVHRIFSHPTTISPCPPACPELWARVTCVWPHHRYDGGACIYSCTDRETAPPHGRRGVSHGKSPPAKMGGRVSGKDNSRHESR